MVEDKKQPRLKPASENIWYALATIAGEPKYYGEASEKINRVCWNGLMKLKLTEEQQEQLVDKDGKK